MNAKDLVKNALRNRKITRPPFIPFIGTYLTRVDQAALQDTWSETGLLHQSLRNTQQLLNYDAVVMPADTTLEAEAFGLTVNWDEGKPAIHHALSEEEVPDFDAQAWIHQGRLPVFIEAARRFAQVEGKHTPLITVVTGPLTLWSRIYGKRPDLGLGSTCIPHLDTLTQAIITLCKSYAEAGADGIVINENEVVDSGVDMNSFAGAYKPVFNVVRHFNIPGILRLGGYPSGLASVGADAYIFDYSSHEKALSQNLKGAAGIALEQSIWSDEGGLNAVKEYFAARGNKGLFLTTCSALDQEDVDLLELQNRIEQITSEQEWTP